MSRHAQAQDREYSHASHVSIGSSSATECVQCAIIARQMVAGVCMKIKMRFAEAILGIHDTRVFGRNGAVHQSGKAVRHFRSSLQQRGSRRLALSERYHLIPQDFCESNNIAINEKWLRMRFVTDRLVAKSVL